MINGNATETTESQTKKHKSKEGKDQWDKIKEPNTEDQGVQEW